MILAAESGDGASLLEQELSFVILLVITAGVALLVKRIRLPFTVALVLVGLAFAFLPADFVNIDINAELILSILVPPLLFEATLHIPWKKLRADLFPVLLFALGGTLIGTFATAALIRPFVDMPWLAAIAFGALISATDPVAVIAFFKSLGVDKRLGVLVDGESLFNDAIAIVAFSLAVQAAEPGQSFEFGGAMADFFLKSFGGLAVGLAIGWIVSELVLANVDDPLIETTTTLAAAYGTYVIAEDFGGIVGFDDGFHLSGILAVVSAGLVIGNTGLKNTSPSTKVALNHFWEILTFLVNSLVFLFIGIKIARIDLSAFRPSLLDIAIAIAIVLAIRAVIVYGFGAAHAVMQPSRRIPMNFRHVQFWGGLRGAISLALALILEEKNFDDDVVNTVLVMTFGVVLFTLLIQGTSMTPLIRRLGLADRSETERRQQLYQAQLYAARAGRDEIGRLGSQGVLFPEMARAMQATYDNEVRAASGDLGSHFQAHPELEMAMLLQARRDALTAEQGALFELGRTGLVESEVVEEAAGEVTDRMAALELIEERWEQVPRTPVEAPRPTRGHDPDERAIESGGAS